jgi:hypothetical protein
MPKDFLLILRTGEIQLQQVFGSLLEQGQFNFRKLNFLPGTPQESPGDFIEHAYLLKADFCSLSALKQLVENKVPYDDLLLFEYISW